MSDSVDDESPPPSSSSIDVSPPNSPENDTLGSSEEEREAVGPSETVDPDGSGPKDGLEEAVIDEEDRRQDVEERVAEQDGKEVEETVGGVDVTTGARAIEVAARRGLEIARRAVARAAAEAEVAREDATFALARLHDASSAVDSAERRAHEVLAKNADVSAAEQRHKRALASAEALHRVLAEKELSTKSAQDLEADARRVRESVRGLISERSSNPSSKSPSSSTTNKPSSPTKAVSKRYRDDSFERELAEMASALDEVDREIPVAGGVRDDIGGGGKKGTAKSPFAAEVEGSRALIERLRSRVVRSGGGGKVGKVVESDGKDLHSLGTEEAAVASMLSDGASTSGSPGALSSVSASLRPIILSVARARAEAELASLVLPLEIILEDRAAALRGSIASLESSVGDEAAAKDRQRLRHELSDVEARWSRLRASSNERMDVAAKMMFAKVRHDLDQEIVQTKLAASGDRSSSDLTMASEHGEVAVARAWEGRELRKAHETTARVKEDLRAQVRAIASDARMNAARLAGQAARASATIQESSAAREVAARELEEVESIRAAADARRQVLEEELQTLREEVQRAAERAAKEGASRKIAEDERNEALAKLHSLAEEANGLQKDGEEAAAIKQALGRELERQEAAIEAAELVLRRALDREGAERASSPASPKSLPLLLPPLASTTTPATPKDGQTPSQSPSPPKSSSSSTSPPPAQAASALRVVRANLRQLWAQVVGSDAAALRKDARRRAILLSTELARRDVAERRRLKRQEQLDKSRAAQVPLTPSIPVRSNSVEEKDSSVSMGDLVAAAAIGWDRRTRGSSAWGEEDQEEEEGDGETNPVFGIPGRRDTDYDEEEEEEGGGGGGVANNHTLLFGESPKAPPPPPPPTKSTISKPEGWIPKELTSLPANPTQAQLHIAIEAATAAIAERQGRLYTLQDELDRLEERATREEEDEARNGEPPLRSKMTRESLNRVQTQLHTERYRARYLLEASRDMLRGSGPSSFPSPTPTPSTRHTTKTTTKPHHSTYSTPGNHQLVVPSLTSLSTDSDTAKVMASTPRPRILLSSSDARDQTANTVASPLFIPFDQTSVTKKTSSATRGSKEAHIPVAYFEPYLTDRNRVTTYNGVRFRPVSASELASRPPAPQTTSPQTTTYSSPPPPPPLPQRPPPLSTTTTTSIPSAPASPAPSSPRRPPRAKSPIQYPDTRSIPNLPSSPNTKKSTPKSPKKVVATPAGADRLYKSLTVADISRRKQVFEETKRRQERQARRMATHTKSPSSSSSPRTHKKEISSSSSSPRSPFPNREPRKVAPPSLPSPDKIDRRRIVATSPSQSLEVVRIVGLPRSFKS